MYLLDLPLAIEYSNSKAFTEKDSREISGWDIGARAAMGLQFVDIPQNFTSRHVIPVEKGAEYCEILGSAVLHHLPNLYCQVPQIEKNFLSIHHVVLNK
jgi:hypothetical protein